MSDCAKTMKSKIKRKRKSPEPDSRIGNAVYVKGTGLALLCVIAVSIAAANVLSVPVPPNFRNPWILKVSLSFYNIYTWMHDVVEYIWDANVRFLCFKSSFFVPPPPPESFFMDVRLDDAVFDGVTVRLYTPTRTRPQRPGVVFYHGGGWLIGNIQRLVKRLVIGSILLSGPIYSLGYFPFQQLVHIRGCEMYDPFCKALANATDSVIVSVEYRLAPEHWFPTPLDDCEVAAKHLLTHGHRYGVDPHRIAIAGDSAGGNLVAAVALRLRDQAFEPALRVQALLYPALQAVDLQTPSYQKNARHPILSQRDMAGFWMLYARGKVVHLEALVVNNHTSPAMKRALYKSYVNHADLPPASFHKGYIPNKLDYGDAELSEMLMDTITNPYFSPLLATNLTDLPKTFIMTMECDVLRDEGILYAQRLQDAGNDVTLVNYESGFHGLISYPIPLVEDCWIATTKLHNYLRTHL